MAKRFCRRALGLLFLLLLPGPGLWAEPEELRQTFLDLLNQQRQKQGLAPLRLEPGLNRAAQAQVDDMVARNYYELTSPDGRTLEDWIRDAGYREQLVTEKIIRTDRPPQALAASWGQFPDPQRMTLLHPEVEELGVGIGQYQGLPLYVFVLARSEASYLSQYTQRLFARQTARFEDLDGLRQEMLRLVNETRAKKKLEPLTIDPALNRAAQARAQEIFQGLKEGRPLPGARDLAQRVRAEGYAFQGGVGESVVQGALSPEETLAALLGRSGRRAEVLGRGYTQLGLGLQFERTGDGFSVVWVQCLARPTVARTAADPRVDWLRRNAVPLRSIDPADQDFADLQPLKQVLGGARIVMLGEQSHWDGATFQAKIRLIEFLHQEMGFDVLAFESGLYDCAKAWEFLRGGEEPLRAAQRGVFGVWSRSRQVAPLFEYLGRQARSASPLEIAGFDNQATGSASGEFLASGLERFLGSAGVPPGEDWPKFVAGLRTLTAFEEVKPPDADVQRAFGRTLDAAEAGIHKRPPSPEAAFWLQVIESLRAYARMTWDLANDDRGAKNLRDEQMARNLLWLARERYPGKKIIVWAATYHEMRNPGALLPLADLPPAFYQGVKTMGDQVWKALGDQVYVLGFTAYDGERGQPGRSAGTLRLAPAREGSLEDLLNRAGQPFALVDFRKPAPGGDWLGRQLVARPLGYTDMRADWSQVLDGMLFIRTMTPSTLAPPREEKKPVAGAVWQEPALGMKLRFIPAGSFDMGSPPEEPGRTTFEPRHTVTLTRPFWIGETEVTQGQWRDLMGSSPFFFKACGRDCPAEFVSWYEATAFANALSAKAGLEACYELSDCTGTLGGGCPGGAEVQKCEGDFRCGVARFKGLDCGGFRLPTEAEWEYAARAGAGTALPTGDLALFGRNDAPALDPIAWYAGNSGVGYAGGMECSAWSQRQEAAKTCGPHPVGLKKPNAWGLHDVIGNVWEMVEDQAVWDAEDERVETGTYGGPQTDPLGGSGPKHVLRGGSWYNFASVCRLAQRGSTYSGRRVRTVGFRLARTAK